MIENKLRSCLENHQKQIPSPLRGKVWVWVITISNLNSTPILAFPLQGGRNVLLINVDSCILFYLQEIVQQLMTI